MFKNRHGDEITFIQREENVIVMTFHSQYYRITKDINNNIMSIDPSGGPYIHCEYNWGGRRQPATDMGDIDEMWKGVKVKEIKYSPDYNGYELIIN
jgi:hypothetical protein